jgi:hypothetical protein
VDEAAERCEGAIDGVSVGAALYVDMRAEARLLDCRFFALGDVCVCACASDDMMESGRVVGGCGREERREITEVFFHRDTSAAQVPGSETGQAMSETGGDEAGLTLARIGRDDSKEAVMVCTVWRAVCALGGLVGCLQAFKAL